MNSYYDANGFSIVRIIRTLHLPWEAANITKYMLRAGRKPGEEVKQALTKAIRYCELGMQAYPWEQYDFCEVVEAYGQPKIAAEVLGTLCAYRPHYGDAKKLLIEWRDG